MVASTGLVLGHNEYTPLSQFERADGNHIVAVSDLPVDPVLMEGYELVAYTQAVEQAAYLAAISDRNTFQAEELARVNLRRLEYPTGPVDVVASFIQGWRAAGGVEGWIDFVVDTVIPCESSWDPNVVSPNGLYRGLGQWDWPAWNEISLLTGYSDIWNPEHQGYNMAFKSRRDGGFAWPGCWEDRWN